MKKVIAALLGIAAIVLPQSAIAQIFNWTENATNQRVTVSGLAPNSNIQVFTPLRLVNQSPRYCGYVRVSYPGDLNNVYIFTSAGDEVDNSTPVLNLKCSSGVWKNSAGLEVNPPNYFINNTDSGTGYVFIKASAPIDINTEGTIKSINRTSNQCGMITVNFRKSSNPSWNPFLQVNGVDSSFLQTSLPPICRKVGNNFVRYVKQ